MMRHFGISGSFFRETRLGRAWRAGTGQGWRRVRTGTGIFLAAGLGLILNVNGKEMEKGKPMIEIPYVFNRKFNGQLSVSEVRNAAAKCHCLNQLPRTAAEWKPAELREKIFRGLGIRAETGRDLAVQITREIQLDGYRIQNLSYLSRPGVRVTGNLYIPAGQGPFPAVLNLHGHWEQGRLAARIQQAGHLLAKSGYVCLAVDAFGAGERCPEHGKFVSHGGLLGGAPLQFGESLMGLQAADNMRGVDLLQSLPYVRKDSIGACGSSGGGNQTMWLAALDERIKAAVPVVSVGTFEAYIMSPNCICEVLPGGLTFTEEAGVLALVAPRALLVVNGTYDVNPAFNPAETRRSVDEARNIYQALGVPRNLRQLTLEEPHAFSEDAQRAMLGFFNLHLKHQGDGEPVAELPPYATLPEKELMVYPPGKRPVDVVSVPEYAREKENFWRKTRRFSKEKLRRILNLEPMRIKRIAEFSPLHGWERIGIEAEDGRLLPLRFRPPAGGNKKVVIFGIPNKKSLLAESRVLREAMNSGLGIIAIDLWGAGENDLRIDPEWRDKYYNRSLIWLGKCLQGKWVEDFQLAQLWLRTRFPEAVIAAGGVEDSTIAAAMFGALQTAPVDLWLDGAPATLGYSRAAARFYGQDFIVPGILTCADMPDLLRQAGGNVHSFNPIK